ncbi:hypothetical protein [Mesobacillus jeotgali]|uniref:hypothetical protein n=1 Tax=Mesobacillus jeotgali TaxID=129985 RepID=UPI00177FED7B|nr:hypothetical protein [Mesobacillus jeotgali]UYZ23300.1 hypothetical protein FOF60_07090 [Mesobacillus jeotgali]
MKHDLISLGCVPLKTYKATFLRDIDHDLIHHYVRGYFDGDGCLSTTRNTWRIDIVGTKDICDYILSIFKNLTGSTVKVTPKGNCYYCSISGINYVKTIMDWIYADASVYLERKYGKYLELQKAFILAEERKMRLWCELSKSMTGRKLTTTTKEKLSIAHRGKKKSLEHKQKIRASNKIRLENPKLRKLRSGDNSPVSKLTSEKVKAIREEFLHYKTPQKQLAIKNGVSYSTIKDIIRRRTWKYEE